MANLEYITDLKPEEYKIIGMSFKSPLGENEDGRMEFELELYMNDDDENGNSKEISEELREEIGQQTMTRNGGGRCNHCNAHISYILIAKNIITGFIHTFGSTCGSDIENFSQYDITKAKEDNMKKRKALKRAGIRKAILEANPGLEEALKTDNDISRNMLEYFKKWDKLSEGQIKFAFKLQTQVAEKKVRIEALIKQEAECSGHFFNPGDKVIVMIKKVGSFSFDSAFGTTFVEKYMTEDGKMLKYMGASPLEISKDEFVKVKGTVKHDSYRGPETKLQRMKIL